MYWRALGMAAAFAVVGLYPQLSDACSCARRKDTGHLYLSEDNPVVPANARGVLWFVRGGVVEPGKSRGEAKPEQFLLERFNGEIWENAEYHFEYVSSKRALRSGGELVLAIPELRFRKGQRYRVTRNRPQRSLRRPAGVSPQVQEFSVAGQLWGQGGGSDSSQARAT